MIFYIAAILTIFDQYSKFLIFHRMQYGESIPVIKNVFHLTFVTNTGIAFGFFKGANVVFIIASLIVIAGIVTFKNYIIDKHSLTSKIACGLILGGALGNLIDRIRLGYVIDFLDFRIWPVFNFADSGITIGSLTLIILLLIKGNKKD